MKISAGSPLKGMGGEGKGKERRGQPAYFVQGPLVPSYATDCFVDLSSKDLCRLRYCFKGTSMPVKLFSVHYYLVIYQSIKSSAEIRGFILKIITQS